MEHALRLVVVHSLSSTAVQPDMDLRDRALRIGLLEGGYNIVAVLPADVHLAERLLQLQPDMIIVDAESDARETLKNSLEHVVMATREQPRPVVLFTENADTGYAQQAFEAGVSAYVVAGLQPERIKPVLEVAQARFNVEQRLRAELASTRTQLAERKLIERAKGLLMQKHGLTEDEAYKRLRKGAMDKNLKLAELAERIVDAVELLG
ncbi:MAG: ANTAR domain-containing protein [Burkholderiaceae bacterium]|nr:MAG: ANTAR domain-containing protein [Burkholderiaceae bacterium]